LPARAVKFNSNKKTINNKRIKYISSLVGHYFACKHNNCNTRSDKTDKT
jgi:hypothetical protein